MAQDEEDAFARMPVPDAARGPAWKVFFITAGGVAGLPVFVLGADVARALGLEMALIVVPAGCAIAAILIAMNGFVASRRGLNTSLLAELAFGDGVASMLRVGIALSLLGWFSVEIGMVTHVLSEIVARTCHVRIPSSLFIMLIALVSCLTVFRGVDGVERLGMLLIPASMTILLLSVGISAQHAPTLLHQEGAGGMTVYQALSALAGAYIAAVTVQPDYSRFVRRPARAALSSFLAVGGIFPAILILSAIAPLAFGCPDLAHALVAFGQDIHWPLIALPVAIVILLSVWMDCSIGLYSSALSLANQFRILAPRACIAGGAVVGAGLSLLGVDDELVPFLMVLSIVFPPAILVQFLQLAIVSPPGDIISTAPVCGTMHDMTAPVIRIRPSLAWAAGVVAGGWSLAGFRGTTGVPVMDALLASGATMALLSIRLPAPTRPSRVWNGDTK